MRRHRHNLKPGQAARLAAYLAQNPALELIYRFKQRLCYLLLKKHKTRKQCSKLVPRLLQAIADLRQSVLPAMVTLGETLHIWHTKMEVLQLQAYGFRNFENYRLRVKVLCS